MQTFLSHPENLLLLHLHLHLLPTLRLPHLHQLHSHFLKSGLSLHPFLSTKLLAAVAPLDLSYAHSLLLHLLPLPPPLFAFNSLLRAISTYSPHSPPPTKLHLSFSLLNSLRSFSLSPDHFSFISSLKTSATARNHPLGSILHASALRTPHYLFIDLRNTLIHFYCACGDVRSARQVFDEMPERRDSISWSTIMNGYLKICWVDEVVGLFRGMRREGFEGNAAAVVCLLSVWVSVGSYWGGVSIHGYCLKSGSFVDLNVATAIANGYVKFGWLESARRVFDETGRRDVVLYNSLVDGYAKGGCLEECLRLLAQMKREGIKCNSSTLGGLLSACASSGNISLGQRLYEIAKMENLELDAVLGTAVLDMFMKSGCIDEAVEVFNKMNSRDVKAWTAMIMGLGINGRAEDALRMFYEMEGEGVRPNHVTFLAVLNACSHGGMVDSAKRFFEKMIQEYGINPGMKHYGCLIDLLGRKGLLDEAYELIRSLPLGGDAMAWRALLAACRVHGHVRLGEVAQRALVDLGHEHPTDSILLTSTYALSGKWEEVGKLRDMEMEGVKAMDRKEAGYSSIEMNG